MRIDNLRSRLHRIEASQPETATPNLILASCPMQNENPTADVIERWLDDGLAHIAFGGRAILYDHGETDLIDEQQWRHRYCNLLPS
jgi:hypothetical protein